MEPAISDELWAQVRKDFARHCLRFKEYKKASENLETSLTLQPEKLKSIHLLLKEKVREGKVDEALKGLIRKSSLATYDYNFECNLLECDCYYEKNAFEDNILKLNDKKAAFEKFSTDIPYSGPLTSLKLNEALQRGPKLSTLNKRLQMVRAGYDDIIGKNAGHCLFKQRRYFSKILDKWIPPEVRPNDGPLVLLGSDPCEFLRNKIEVVVPKTVKQQYHQKKTQKFFAQNYLHAASTDYVFLSDLRSDNSLKESTQNANSFRNINKAIDECMEMNSKVIAQLHARCPLYTKHHKTRSEKRDKTIKFRMMDKIRREMFNALEEIQKCHAENKLEKLIKLAENELGVRYRIHPSCLMPRKSEFIVDICNYIGLGHINDLTKSSAMIHSTDCDEYDLLRKLLRIYWETKSRAVPYVFGDQSTYRDPAEPDTSYLIFKEKIDRLEARIAQKPMFKIEKCHLLYEFGRANLKQQRPDEAREFCREIIKEAQGVSHIWIFLGRLTLCRADVLQKQFEKAEASIADAIEMVDILKSDELKLVLEKALEIAKRLS